MDASLTNFLPIHNTVGDEIEYINFGIGYIVKIVASPQNTLKGEWIAAIQNKLKDIAIDENQPASSVDLKNLNYTNQESTIAKALAEIRKQNKITAEEFDRILSGQDVTQGYTLTVYWLDEKNKREIFFKEAEEWREFIYKVVGAKRTLPEHTPYIKE